MFNRLRRRRAPVSQEQLGFSPANQNWVLVLMILAFCAIYWYIAWLMESIPADWINRWLASNAPIQIAFPPRMAKVITFFAPRVLRHLIPLFIGLYVARQIAINLLQLLYDLPEREQARKFLRRLHRPNSPVNRALALDGQNLEEERPKFVRLRVGGPGRISVKTGRVAVTELNGRFYRTLGPGSHNLARFEYVRAVLDLRPQQRKQTDISVTTQDKMPLKADLSVVYRISTGGEPIRASNPYPYDREAVRKLAYTEVNTGGTQVRRWEGNALGTVVGQFRKAIGKLPLADLHTSGDSEPYLTVRRATEQGAREALAAQGIDLVRVHVTRIDLDEELADQYMQFWRARMETQAFLELANGRANVLEEIEVAQAEAELTMIQAIVEGVQRAQNEGRTARLNEIVAVRLVEALERLARQSQGEETLPEDLLPQLTSLQSRIGLTAGENTAPAADQ